MGHDGSMHTFKKLAHTGKINDIAMMMQQSSDKWITTPIYPMQESHLEEILNEILKFNTTNILIYSETLRSAEINLLFQYHKIAIGTLNLGLDIFFNSSAKNLKNWNKDYTHWSQSQPWELREWFSLFYPEWVQEWINSQYQVDDSWLLIKNTDILYSPVDQFKKIINFCGLTEFKGIESFSAKWQTAQKYIVDEFNLLDNITDSTINNIPLQWNSLNIIAEAIIQQRLRALGYEIRCDGLNTFPTDSKTLYNLLEKV